MKEERVGVGGLEGQGGRERERQEGGAVYPIHQSTTPSSDSHKRVNPHFLTRISNVIHPLHFIPTFLRGPFVRRGKRSNVAF